MTKAITIGSKVRIAYTGNRYSTYAEWANEHGLTKYKDYARTAKNGDEGFVVAIGKHRSNGETLYGVLVNGVHEIYGEAGIELIGGLVANGVDGDGLPLNFTEADLKPGMRVITDHDAPAIVYGHHDCWGPGVAVVYDDGFDMVRTVGFKEVYAAPDGPWAMLKPTSRGKLIWRKADTQRLAAIEAADKAIAEAEATVAAATEKLAEAKAAKAAL